MVFELYSKKYIELFSMPNRHSNVDFRMQNDEFVKYSIKRCRFSEYFIDYDIYDIKKRLAHNKAADSIFSKKLKKYNDLTTDEDSKIIKEFTLTLFKINSRCLYKNKLRKMEKKLESIYLKKNTVKFLIMYIFIFIIKNDKPLEYNPEVVRLLENLIMKNVANLFETGNNDNETLFGILVICYEISCSEFINKETCFSPKFLKFFKNFSLWYSAKIWDYFIEYLFGLVSSQIDFIYFSDIVKFDKEKKNRVRKSIKIYEFTIFIAFYFLKLPFELILDIMNEINERTKDVTRNDIYDLSKQLESKIEINYKASALSTRIMIEPVSKLENLELVLKKAIVYLDIKKDDINKLLFLNKKIYSKVRYGVYKMYLRFDKLTMQSRLQLWENLTNCKIDSKTNLIPNSRIFSLDERSTHVLKMDVRRTSFARMNSTHLEKLLLEIADHHPSTAYYQGMNCIGGFLLNYTDNYVLSKKVFSFLVKKRLEVYFLNSFSRLKKLLFIAERIIKTKLPELNDYFAQLQITTEFYLSPLLLTIFSASLQFIDNYNLVAKIFDIFIADGWPAFFKVFVWVFSRLQKKLFQMNYEKILQFLNKEIHEAIFCLDISNFKKELDEIKINKSLIASLEREYDRTRKVVEEYWNNYYEKKKSEHQ